jgi:hypothetical protein
LWDDQGENGPNSFKNIVTQGGWRETLVNNMYEMNIQGILPEIPSFTIDKKVVVIYVDSLISTVYVAITTKSYWRLCTDSRSPKDDQKSSKRLLAVV